MDNFTQLCNKLLKESNYDPEYVEYLLKKNEPKIKARELNKKHRDVTQKRTEALRAGSKVPSEMIFKMAKDLGRELDQMNVRVASVDDVSEAGEEFAKKYKEYQDLIRAGKEMRRREQSSNNVFINPRSYGGRKRWDETLLNNDISTFIDVQKANEIKDALDILEFLDRFPTAIPPDEFRQRIEIYKEKPRLQAMIDSLPPGMFGGGWPRTPYMVRKAQVDLVNQLFSNVPLVVGPIKRDKQYRFVSAVYPELFTIQAYRWDREAMEAAQGGTILIGDVSDEDLYNSIDIARADGTTVFGHTDDITKHFDRDGSEIYSKRRWGPIDHKFINYAADVIDTNIIDGEYEVAPGEIVEMSEDDRKQAIKQLAQQLQDAYDKATEVLDDEMSAEELEDEALETELMQVAADHVEKNDTLVGILNSIAQPKRLELPPSMIDFDDENMFSDYELSYTDLTDAEARQRSVDRYEASRPRSLGGGSALGSLDFDDDEDLFDDDDDDDDDEKKTSEEDDDDLSVTDGIDILDDDDLFD